MHGGGGRTTRGDHSRTPVAENALIEAALLEATTVAEELGCAPVAPETGAVLRFLAAARRARAVVEIGTGTGVSGLWLLRGMSPDGVLTSIDAEPEHQRSARAVFSAAGFPPGRVRLINGMALNVLPRLADGAYDLIFVDAVLAEYPRYLDAAVRLLRAGGVVALRGVPQLDQLPGGRGDPESQALGEALRTGCADDRLVALPLPIGESLLLAAKVS